MIRPHAERGRWWTDETTRYLPVLIGGETAIRCEACNGDAFGRYGDGYRCHDCGRPVSNVADGAETGAPHG